MVKLLSLHKGRYTNTRAKKVQATTPKTSARTSRPSTVTQYLARLNAPVEFARRADGAKLAMIRNLGAFLDRCAQEGLEETSYRAIHPYLHRLRRLIAGYDQSVVGRRKEALDAVASLLLSVAGHDRSSASAPMRGRRRHGAGGSTEKEAEAISLAAPIQDLPGVGPRRAAMFRRLGVERVGDLLWLFPWRYLDRVAPVPLSAVSGGADVTVYGEVRTVDEVVTSRRRIHLLNAVLGDPTGTIGLRWFNQPFLVGRLVPGQTLMCSGRVKPDGLFQRWRMDNPQFEILSDSDTVSLHMGRVVPAYHETRGITSRLLRVCIDRVLKQGSGLDVDPLPSELIARRGLLSRREALMAVHFPPPSADVAQYNAGRSPAHQRLIFEELFLLELGLAVRRHQTAREDDGIAFRCVPARLDAFWKALPFSPTGAQRRVVDEVLGDMAAARPMNRLIQGDVGCGKTVVAAAAMWMAMGDGYQTALMAPTELLAEQHHRQVLKLLGPLGIRIGMVTGDQSARERSRVLASVARHDLDCVIGTHALAQPDIRFGRLGFAVIDEQHKFGVLQRSHLVRKGDHPDIVIMTATPIPRTLALTVYGDLDISVVDAMPGGRRPIETRWYSERQRPSAHEVIRHALHAGQQIYVVAPRIDESDGEIRSASRLAERLQREIFPDASIGLLHGRLPRGDKDRVMAGFVEGAIQILVATTVVEVGIDVPNATVMLIEHADQYGLAQLHQLRGRVGRGPLQSRCLLMSGSRVSDEARERLEAMVMTSDGFQIAERDLALRGPGEFLGTRQSGLPDLRAANLVRDGIVLEEARQEAFALLKRDPSLTHPQHAALKEALMHTWGARLALGAIG